MSIAQSVKCHTCQGQFEVTFTLEQIQNGLLPAPPEQCPSCAMPAAHAATPPERLSDVPNGCTKATLEAAAAADKSTSVAGAQHAQAFLNLPCQDCRDKFRLGFQVYQWLQGDISSTITYRCIRCSGSPASKKHLFAFELPATDILPCPDTLGPSASAVVPLTLPKKNVVSSTMDSLWQVDCDGDPLV